MDIFSNIFIFPGILVEGSLTLNENSRLEGVNTRQTFVKVTGSIRCNSIVILNNLALVVNGKAHFNGLILEKEELYIEVEFGIITWWWVGETIIGRKDNNGIYFN
jgi:hypothetical protein